MRAVQMRMDCDKGVRGFGHERVFRECVVSGTQKDLRDVEMACIRSFMPAWNTAGVNRKMKGETSLVLRLGNKGGEASEGQGRRRSGWIAGRRGRGVTAYTDRLRAFMSVRNSVQGDGGGGRNANLPPYLSRCYMAADVSGSRGQVSWSGGKRDKKIERGKGGRGGLGSYVYRSLLLVFLSKKRRTDENCPHPLEDLVLDGEVGVPLPRAVTMNKPNVFDNKRKHLTSWIRKVKRYFRLTGIPVERHLDLVINCLNDVEQNYIEDLEEKQGIVVNTLNDLFVALRKRFINTKEQEILRKELYVVEGEDLDAPYAVTTVRAVNEIQAPWPRMIRFQEILEGTLVRVLLDSGAHELFISLDFCHTRRFPVRPLKHLRGCKRAVKVDGKEAFYQVTECIAPLKLSIQGYEEKMKFTLAELDNEYDIFPGMKWLEAHNPQID
uniref:Uncharacterized protein n=1 Tax=Chromera velia CCMP2878 TaxID=1169474 RepID=A0A0G4HZV2_9ALVE|eukprot:Cvel_9812.t1-p1 / transcript=Cvel_9812.t1 / gene=Cvel_9812 / organism=Chromera_velia_CCMP2878 / gene_product=hypothetical protein / transcript_product=hypothetical protein / location=Cvel_scaffold576:18417-24765(-) / protein_length=437 / sequence_SO=supercontig / SO=protein_coding / is_pseudo=false